MELIAVISSAVVSFHLAHSKPQTNVCRNNELVLLPLAATKMKEKGHISAWDPFEGIRHPERPRVGTSCSFSVTLVGRSSGWQSPDAAAGVRV